MPMMPLIAVVLLLPQIAAQPALKFTFATDVSDLRIWFNQTTDACNVRDTPDNAITAFRRDDGMVVAFSGDNDVLNGVSFGGFYRSVGPSITELKRDCSAPIIAGGKAGGAPDVFPHNVWITASWTEDGETVHALVHDEYHANLSDPIACPAGSKKPCWYTTILAAKSIDGGKTFQYRTSADNPRGIAVASPAGYMPGVTGGRPQGMPNHHLVGDPRDGYVYLLASCAQGAHLPSEQFPNGGKCVWRTHDVSDVQSWRGWDGTAWTVTVVDPYAVPAPSANGHLPAVVGAGSAASGSVTYLEAFGLFLAMDSHVTQQKGQAAIFHVSYQTSTNMTVWSKTRTAGSFERPQPFVGAIIYPHVMDAKSPSRNFDVIGASSQSIYFQFITGIPGDGLFRAGVAMPVTIELELNDEEAGKWSV